MRSKPPISRGPNGRPLCRCGCNREVQPPRRSWFSQDCVTRYLLLHDWGFIRARILERDKGVCAKCKVDCLSIQAHGWRLWNNEDTKALAELARQYPGFRLGKDYWEVDHIVEKARGGTNAQDNLQTLCHACHKRKTAAFNHSRASNRKNRSSTTALTRTAGASTTTPAETTPKRGSRD